MFRESIKTSEYHRVPKYITYFNPLRFHYTTFLDHEHISHAEVHARPPQAAGTQYLGLLLRKSHIQHMHTSLWEQISFSTCPFQEKIVCTPRVKNVPTTKPFGNRKLPSRAITNTLMFVYFSWNEKSTTDRSFESPRPNTCLFKSSYSSKVKLEGVSHTQMNDQTLTQIISPWQHFIVLTLPLVTERCCGSFKFENYDIWPDGLWSPCVIIVNPGFWKKVYITAAT